MEETEQETLGFVDYFVGGVREQAAREKAVVKGLLAVIQRMQHESRDFAHELSRDLDFVYNEIRELSEKDGRPVNLYARIKEERDGIIVRAARKEDEHLNNFFFAPYRLVEFSYDGKKLTVLSTHRFEPSELQQKLSVAPVTNFQLEVTKVPSNYSINWSHGPIYYPCRGQGDIERMANAILRGFEGIKIYADTEYRLLFPRLKGKGDIHSTIPHLFEKFFSSYYEDSSQDNVTLGTLLNVLKNMRAVYDAALASRGSMVDCKKLIIRK